MDNGERGDEVLELGLDAMLILLRRGDIPSGMPTWTGPRVGEPVGPSDMTPSARRLVLLKEDESFSGVRVTLRRRAVFETDAKDLWTEGMKSATQMVFQ